MFKFLLLGAFTFSLAVGFVGCKNYDDDIDKICKRLDLIDASIEDLQDQIDDITIGADVYVKSAAVVNGKLILTLTDNTTVEVTLPVPVGGDAPYVVENPDGSFTLFILDEDGEEQEVLLAGESSGLTEIKILGWTSGYLSKDGSQAISLNGGDNTDKVDADAWGGTPANAGAIMNLNGLNVNYAGIEKFKVNGGGSALTTTLNDPTGESTTTAAGDATPNAWGGGAKPLAANMVLNTLSAEGKGLVIRVFPANNPISSTTFTLVSNTGSVLPIKFGTPIRLVGSYTTRADYDGGALYFLPGDYTMTPYKPATAFKEYTDFFGTFTSAAYNAAGADTGPLYALSANGVAVSDFSTFTATATPITSTIERKVENLATTGTPEEKLVTTAATINGTPTQVYNAKVNVQYAAEFVPAAATAVTNNDAVVDYRFDYVDPTNFTAGKFGVSFADGNTKFTVTRLPDDLTLATFQLLVSKLSVKGEIYKEIITIRPVREGLLTPLPVQALVLSDRDTKATNATALLSGEKNVVIDLQPMFNQLAQYTSDNTNLAERWQTSDYGAHTYAISNVTIDGVAFPKGSVADSKTAATAWITALGNAGGNFQGATKADGSDAFNLDGATNKAFTSKYLVVTPVYATADNSQDTWGGAADDADSNPDPAYTIGATYAITLDFFDRDGDYINSIVYSFIPTIPSLVDMLEKQPAFWNTDQTVLNAYYRQPATWAATGMSTRYDIAQGSYGAIGVGDTGTGVTNGDIAATTAGKRGGDGGFVKVGGVDTDTEWATIKFNIDPEFEIDGVAAVATVTGTPPTPATASVEYALTVAEDATGYNRIFELYYQNDAANAAQKAKAVKGDGTTSEMPDGTKDAYGVELPVQLANTLYLDVYPFDEDDYTAAAFSIKIMSALYEGSLEPAEDAPEIIMPAASIGETKQLDHTMIKGKNYNDEEYNLFTSAPYVDGSTLLATYDYTYVRSVAFRVPTKWTNIYSIIGGGTVAATDGGNDWVTEIKPTEPTTASDPDNWGYLEIRSGEISKTEHATIEVRVIDRFGKVKQDEVNIQITHK